MTIATDQHISIPLIYRDVKDIRQITEAEEYDVSRYSGNSLVTQYPITDNLQALTDFRSVGFPFPSGYLVKDITHAVNPTLGTQFWYAIVQPSPTSISQIWRSSDQVLWNPCPIDKSDYSIGNFFLNKISTEYESGAEATTSGPFTIVAVGVEGLVLVSDDYNNFRVVPQDDIATNPNSWKSTDLVDTAYDLDNDKWMIVNKTTTPWQCAINDSTVDESNWTIVSNPLSGDATSVIWGQDRSGNGRFIVAGNGEMSYSDNLGSTWNSVTLPSISTINFNQVKWSAVAELFFAVGSDATGGVTFKSYDGITWTRVNITLANGVVIKQIDFGNNTWIAVSNITNRMWYSNNADPLQLYYNEISTTQNRYNASAIEFAGGNNDAWLMASDTSNEILVGGKVADYLGALVTENYGAISIPIGSFTNTYYDSSNNLVTDVQDLYQISDSDEATYEVLYGYDQPIFLGTDSEGDLYEMYEGAVFALSKRLSEEIYYNDMSGSFQLANDDSAPDSADWEVWESEALINTIDSSTQETYSIYRKKLDTTVGVWPEDLLEIDAFFDDPYVLPDGYVAVDYFIDEYFNGIKPFSNNNAARVLRNMIHYAYEKTGVGRYMLLPEGQVPLSVAGEEGLWKQVGYALDSRREPTGIQEIGKYYLWVKYHTDIIL